MEGVAFVTGGGGFLGGTLVEALLRSGAAVRALDLRFPPGVAEGAEQLQGDVCDESLLERGCSDAGVVFHLAALLPQRHASPEEMRRVNVEGTRRVLEAARAAGVRRFVQVSSAEVYGLPRVVPCPEDGPKEPLGEYGRNKVESEALVRAAAAQGLPAVILRPPTIIGPRMPERLLLGMLSALRKGRPLFVPGGPERFQMVAVSDMVRACLVAAESSEAAAEAFNIGAADVPSQADVFRRLRDRVGSRSRVIALPRPLLRSLARVLLAIGRSPLEPEHLPIAFGDYVFDITKARERLGWQPERGNVEALAGAYDWLAQASPTR